MVPLSRTSIRATPGEEQVYAQLVTIRDGVRAGRIGSIAIVQWGMYKAFLSSPEACASTVEKPSRSRAAETVANRPSRSGA